MNISQNKNVKIILSGGGTGGSVTPLLAMVDLLRSGQGSKSLERLLEPEFLWIGTKDGPERQLVESSGIRFMSIPSGKLRRYLSLQNVLDFFQICLGFWQSFFIVLKEKPNLIISAGSFVSAPLAWAAWILRAPVLIHQLDARPGLANKLMAPFAKTILVTFKKSLADYGKKAILTGNPIRKEFIENKIGKREAAQKIGMRTDKPIALVIGGGTGAGAINALILKNIGSLTKVCQILHITGKGKSSKKMEEAMEKNPGYKFFEFLDAFGLIKVFAAADIIISRAGMGTLTELSYAAKPTILIPMPDSHQEENAEIFFKEEAAIVLSQKELDGGILLSNIKKILKD
ncbi:MAG: UDP-N-acetylglucosamine--N-acetylmuramyl-(pentapeptide) pyrophosphoryl-undecaprenol N-acetylglucosamine transferase, partial [Patescibacteria group bacterium]|nr:UDP-N-acetylglucosamine--N-acetylmuramyl-(pentapeptide) pyrophosphoryl-undecaprenol N-acetylglucosamine transferase [Patescibacteria group bacterium]